MLNQRHVNGWLRIPPDSFSNVSLEHSPPTANSLESGLRYDAKKANRAFHFLIGEAVESPSVFISSRIVFDEIVERRKSKTTREESSDSWNPIQIGKRCLRRE